MPNDFKPGDRVYVVDPGLRHLRDIMRGAGHRPFPNHHGTVHEIDGDEIEIWFDNEEGEGLGTGAPYPRAQVRHFPDPEYPETSDGS